MDDEQGCSLRVFRGGADGRDVDDELRLAHLETKAVFEHMNGRDLRIVDPRPATAEIIDQIAIAFAPDFGVVGGQSRQNDIVVGGASDAGGVIAQGPAFVVVAG